MPSQKDLEKSYGEGKADRAAGKPDRTQGRPEDIIAHIASGGLTTLLPGESKESQDSYSAGYDDDDDD